jgi:hypothetical protein
MRTCCQAFEKISTCGWCKQCSLYIDFCTREYHNPSSEHAGSIGFHHRGHANHPHNHSFTNTHQHSAIHIYSLHPSHNQTHNDNISGLQTPLPRIQTPHPRPTGWHHCRPRRRRRPLRLGSTDRRARGHSLRRRYLSRRTQVSQGLPFDAADDEVSL